MDEKKKILVLGGLGAMLVAIGAFQFMPKGEDPVVTSEAPKETPKYLQNAESDPAAGEPPKNPFVANRLAQRDPFAPPASAVVSTMVQPDPLPQAQPQAKPLRTISSGSVRPFNVPPLPEISGVVSADPKDGITTVSEVVKPEPEPFGYTVSGVVIGRRPAVVLRDSQGNQRLVTEGSAIDGDSKVQSVRETYVSVVYLGKTLRLPVGGESVAK